MFWRLLLGIIALSVFVLASRKDRQSLAPPALWEDFQHAIDTVGIPVAPEGEEDDDVASSVAPEEEEEEAAGMEDFEQRPASSASSRAGRGGSSSALSRQRETIAPTASTEAPQRIQALVRTVRWTWPVPVVPPEGQAIVGRILFRGSCTGPMTIARMRLAYSGANPFLIGGVGLIDTSEGEPLTELTPITVGMQRGKGEVDLALEPPVTLDSCERDPTVSLDERTDLRSMDIVVSAHVDTNEWSVHRLSFLPEGVTADGPLVWDDAVNPVEGVFQFFTGTDAKRKSQEGRR